MAISRVDSNKAANGALTYSGTYLTGDYIVLQAVNASNSTNPTQPAGYSTIASTNDSTNGFAMSLYGKFATSSSETAPTVTNADTLTYIIYRGVDTTTPFINVAGQAATSVTATVSWSGIASFGSSNDWVLTSFVSKSASGNMGTHPPTAQTLVQDNTSLGENTLYDSNTNVSSFTFRSQTADTAIFYISKTIELVAFAGTVLTKTQSATSRIANVKTKTQSAVARIVSSPLYTYGTYSSLPSGTSPLTNIYSASDVTNVSSEDSVYVNETGALTYLIHQFAILSTDTSKTINPVWKGKIGKPASSSALTLQIYNNNSGLWETLSTNTVGSPGSNVTISGSQTTSLPNYYDSNNYCFIRVYQ